MGQTIMIRTMQDLKHITGYTVESQPGGMFTITVGVFVKPPHNPVGMAYSLVNAMTEAAQNQVDTLRHDLDRLATAEPCPDVMCSLLRHEYPLIMHEGSDGVHW